MDHSVRVNKMQRALWQAVHGDCHVTHATLGLCLQAVIGRSWLNLICVRVFRAQEHAFSVKEVVVVGLEGVAVLRVSSDA